MAGQFFCLLLACLTIGVCTGMTTVAHTKPPHEYDILAFNYDPHVPMLAMSERYRGAKSCFVLDLTADEQVRIHTHDGMTQLQLKMLTHVSSATKTPITLDELTAQSKKLGHSCSHVATVYKITI